MTISIGMAIQITEKNQDRIAIVNGGIVPELEDTPTYFFFPYNFSDHCCVLSKKYFFENYRFANAEQKHCFVDVEYKV